MLSMDKYSYISFLQNIYHLLPFSLLLPEILPVFASHI